MRTILGLNIRKKNEQQRKINRSGVRKWKYSKTYYKDTKTKLGSHDKDWK